MNNRKLIQIAIPVILSLAFISPATFADNHSPQVLAETSVITPKVGQSEAMLAGIKKHRHYRVKQEDPRAWRFYSPILRDQLDNLAIRSFGFSWAAMDTYREWRFKNDTQKNFNMNVDKYVSDYQHYISIIDAENSDWAADVKYRYVGVTSYMVKPGHRGAIEQDKKIMSDAAKAQKWPFNWQWSYNLSSRDTLTLAVPFKDWGSMAPPETTFAQVLTKHLGNETEAKQVLERWSSHFSATEYNVWGLREDMMTDKRV
ncbi:MAG: hypothetical protein ACI9IT_000278 [Glaciecola sp.]|jgi:hypothetical protein